MKLPVTCHTHNLEHLAIMSAFYSFVFFEGGGVLIGKLKLASFCYRYKLIKKREDVIFMCSKVSNSVSSEGNAVKKLPQKNVNSVLRGMNEVCVSAEFDFHSQDGSRIS